MSKDKTLQLVISKEGLVRAICTDQTLSFLQKLSNNEIDVRRASHVEWSTGIRPEAVQWLIVNRTDCATGNISAGWWADLLPSDGPVLGPFNTHIEAIEAELNWLKENQIPIGDKDEC